MCVNVGKFKHWYVNDASAGGCAAWAYLAEDCPGTRLDYEVVPETCHSVRAKVGSVLLECGLHT